MLPFLLLLEVVVLQLDLFSVLTELFLLLLVIFLLSLSFVTLLFLALQELSSCECFRLSIFFFFFKIF